MPSIQNYAISRRLDRAAIHPIHSGGSIKRLLSLLLARLPWHHRYRNDENIILLAKPAATHPRSRWRAHMGSCKIALMGEGL